MTKCAISTKLRLDIFLKDKGQCQACKTTISPGQLWDLDHITPRANGASNDQNNLQVLCQTCQRQKTKHRDVPRIAKTKRQRAGYLGAKRPVAVIPGSRLDPEVIVHFKNEGEKNLKTRLNAALRRTEARATRKTITQSLKTAASKTKLKVKGGVAKKVRMKSS